MAIEQENTEIEDSSDNLAKYQQISKHLKRQILEEGKYLVGAMIPPEVELAKQYQVSRTTIRHALNVLVEEGLLERTAGKGTFVQRPDSFTPSVKREKRIGVMLVSANDQLSSEILKGIEQVAKSRDYQISLTYSEDVAGERKRDISRLIEDRVSGFVIFPFSNAKYDLDIIELHTAGVPIVLVDRYFPNVSIDYVVADNFNGGYRATEHLLILGHNRIGFIYNQVGNLDTSGVHDRWAGYRQALEDYGLPYDESLIFEYPILTDVNGSYFIELLTQPKRPDAFFLVTDLDAPPFFQAARQQKLEIPGDIAVVGFDNTDFSAILNPPLTTIAHPRIEIGLRAGHIIIDRIEGRINRPQQVVLPTRLVVRESCGARQHVKRLHRDGYG